MLRAKPISAVYRFREFVAAHVYSGSGAAYLTAKEAREIARALVKAAQSIERESFAESNVPHFELDKPKKKGAKNG